MKIVRRHDRFQIAESFKIIGSSRVLVGRFGSHVQVLVGKSRAWHKV